MPNGNPLFTPQFNQQLGAFSALLGSSSASEVVNRLRGKTGLELQNELRRIFETISNLGQLRLNSSQAQEFWKGLNGLLNYVAQFDADVKKRLDEINQGTIEKEKQEAFLGLLKHRNFIEKCAKLMEQTTQQQIDTIMREWDNKMSEIAESRARQAILGGWSQVGAIVVDLLHMFAEILGAQQGYDVTSERSSPRKSSSFQFLPAPPLS